jgi:hypothetical protein
MPIVAATTIGTADFQCLRNNVGPAVTNAAP